MLVNECKDCKWYKKDPDTQQDLCMRYNTEIKSIPDCVAKIDIKHEGK